MRASKSEVEVRVAVKLLIVGPEIGYPDWRFGGFYYYLPESAGTIS
jgi:hypothetical protein